MHAGDLNERVEIQSRTVTRNSLGEEVVTWATSATVWAKVRMAGGDEKADDGQMVSTGRWDVTLRYRTGITTYGSRLRWRGQILNIVQADPQSPIGRLVLKCEGQTDG